MEKEQIKINIAAIFIATYTSLIFTLPKILDNYTQSGVQSTIFLIFVVFGVLIDFCFFLFIAFSAVELDNTKRKELFFDVELSSQHIEKAKNKLYHWGTSLIFQSLSMPVYSFLVTLIKNPVVSKWISFLIFGLVWVIIRLILILIFPQNKSTLL